MLLMLALYDADSNALQRQVDRDLDEAGQYEQLLRTFAAREVRKGPSGRSDAEIELAVDADLLRLSVVAFAMFNRGRQWVADELDADLAVLHGEPARHGGLRADLGGGETVLGRFFFIQCARAVRDGDLPVLVPAHLRGAAEGRLGRVSKSVPCDGVSARR